MRLSEYVEKYWLKRKEKEVEPTTLTRYKGVLRRILPAMGHYRLENIQPGVIMPFTMIFTRKSVRTSSVSLPIFAEKYARRTTQDPNLQKSAELEWLWRIRSEQAETSTKKMQK